MKEKAFPFNQFFIPGDEDKTGQIAAFEEIITQYAREHPAQRIIKVKDGNKKKFALLKYDQNGNKLINPITFADIRQKFNEGRVCVTRPDKYSLTVAYIPDDYLCSLLNLNAEFIPEIANKNNERNGFLKGMNSIITAFFRGVRDIFISTYQNRRGHSTAAGE